MTDDARKALAGLAAKAKTFTDSERKRMPRARVVTARPMQSSASARDASLIKSLSSAPSHVPAEGSSLQPAKLLFVSAEPLPAESAAGKLLSKIIQAMGLPREGAEVCSPGELEARISARKPLALVSLGAAATEAILKNGVELGKLRGRFAEHAGLPLMPTHHPAELVENDTLKRHVWEDMKLVAAKLKP